MRVYQPLSAAAAVLLMMIGGPLAAQQEHRITGPANPPGVLGPSTQCSCSTGATVLLDQAPDQVTAFTTDVGLPQSEADGFVLTAPATISEIRIWGGYFAGDVPPSPDDFTVIFHSDAAGLPGATAAPAETGLAAACRETTGVNLLGVDEYVIRLDLASPVTLGPGTYWLEIFNDTTSNPGNLFAWESGVEDPVAGVFSHAFAAETPAVTWLLSGSGVSFAAQLCETAIAPPPSPIPTLGQSGLIALALLLASASFYLLNRRRKASLPTFKH